MPDTPASASTRACARPLPEHDSRGQRSQVLQRGVIMQLTVIALTHYLTPPPVPPHSQATKKRPVPSSSRDAARAPSAYRRRRGMPACPSTASPNVGDVESASAQQGSRWSKRAPKYRSRNGAIESSNVWKRRCSHGKRSDAATPTRSDRDQRISAGSVPIYAASQCGPYHSTEDAQRAAHGWKNEPVQPSDHKTWSGHAMGRNPSHLFGNRPVTRRRRARANVGDFERR